MNLPVILYFIDGPVPSLEDKLAAFELNGRVKFRNAQCVGDETCLEKCDAVAGCVPECYKDCPSVEEAEEDFVKQLEAAKESAKEADAAHKKGAAKAKETRKITKAPKPEKVSHAPKAVVKPTVAEGASSLADWKPN